MIDREYARKIKDLMPDQKRMADLDSPVSMWKEMDRIRGFPEKTAVVIYRTTGCSWYRFSSCSMCGYFNDVSPEVKEENLFRQIDRTVAGLNGEQVLKVFTSGSFLDPVEFPLSAREYFFDQLSGKIDRFLVESRTEYLTGKNLEKVSGMGSRIRIAIGLESANDRIMEKSINKGSTFRKYLNAAGVVKSLGMELRTYLLLKPPFIPELAAIKDISEAVSKVRDISTDISINPMNIQKNTMVELLWKTGLYRPPRLWSVADALLDASDQGAQVVSYPTGGNRERGAHNDKPDPTLLKLIVDSSLNQDFTELKEYCKSADRENYRKELELESVLFTQMDYRKYAGRLSSSSITI